MTFYSIQVEGVDGSGKGKIISGLVDRFKDKINIKIFKFPGGDEKNSEYDIIRDLCKSDKYYRDGISTLINLMNMVSTVSYYKSTETQDTLIIYDRFYLSNLVYDTIKINPYGQENIIKFREDHKNIEPDYTIVSLGNLDDFIENNKLKDDNKEEKYVSSEKNMLHLLQENYKHKTELYYPDSHSFFINNFEENLLTNSNFQGILDTIEKSLFKSFGINYK